MRSAELLNLAAVAARVPDAKAAARSAGEADAFARALDSHARTAADAARSDVGAGDGHCGVAPTSTGANEVAQSDTAAADAVTPRTPRDPPVRSPRGEHGLLGSGNMAETAAARSDWRDFLRNLRQMLSGASHADPTADAAADPTARTSGTSTPKTTDAPAAATPFGEALTALRAAIQAALADPAANAATPGQLPPAVQTALDAAIAAAPAQLQGRLQNFGQRLTDRLAAAMAAADGTTADPAQVAAGASEKTHSQGALASALLAALNGPANGSALAMLNDIKARGDLADQLKASAATAAEASAKPASSRTAPVPTTAGGTDTAKAPHAAAATPDPTSAKTEVAAPAAQAAIDSATPAAANAETALAAGPDSTVAAETAAKTSAAPLQAAVDARAAAAAVATRGAPELVAQMAATISRKLEGRITRFNMELNPAEMGRVDVKLSIEADGRVAAQMSFDNPAAAADMRGKADDLRRQLEQAGFTVASEDLTFTDRQPGQQFAGTGREEATPEVARGRAFREAERTARLAEDAGRLSNRAVLGLDMRV